MTIDTSRFPDCQLTRRFIVDGEWKTCKQEAVYKDDGVNENHILTIPRSTNNSVSRVVMNL